MAILRSVDGRFYEIPDDQVSKYLIPADKVKEKLEGAGAPASPPPGGGGPGGGPPSGGPTILVQVFGAGGTGAPPPPSGAGQEQAAPAEIGRAHV